MLGGAFGLGLTLPLGPLVPFVAAECGAMTSLLGRSPDDSSETLFGVTLSMPALTAGLKLVF